jgi:hypothetical protein
MIQRYSVDEYRVTMLDHSVTSLSREFMFSAFDIYRLDFKISAQHPVVDDANIQGFDVG